MKKLNLVHYLLAAILLFIPAATIAQSSNPPLVLGTQITIEPGAPPTAAPNPSPTATATPAPGATPVSISTTYTDVNLPPVGWRPMASCGVKDTTCTIAPDGNHINWPAVCAANLLTCANGMPPLSTASGYDSTTIVNNTIATASFKFGICRTAGVEGGPTNGNQGTSECLQNLDGFAVFFSGPSVANTTTVPRTINCVLYNQNSCAGWGYNYSNHSFIQQSGGSEGQTMYFPDWLISQGGGSGSDNHIYLLDEANGVEDECWQGFTTTYQRASQSGTTFNCGSNSAGSLRTDNSGVDTYDAPYSGVAANTENVGELIRPEEMIAAATNPVGAIKHAIALSVAYNGSSASVYPGNGHHDGNCGGSAGNNYGVEGSYYILDPAGHTAVMASSENNFYKAIADAAYNYGIIDIDSSGCTAYNNFEVWGSAGYVAANLANPGSVANPWDSSTLNNMFTGNFTGSTDSQVLSGNWQIPSGGSYGISHYHVVNLACSYYLITGNGSNSTLTAGQSCPHP